MPFFDARSCTSRSSAIASAARSSSSVSRTIRSRGERISSSSCFSSGPKSIRAASSNASSGESRSGSSISDEPVELDDPPEHLERLVDLLVVGRLVVVLDRLDLGGLERAPVGQVDQPEARAALDDHVHPSVGELLQHLGDGGAGADLGEARVAREQQAELAALAHALADQLLVALLEDVERDALGRQQHELEWEEADLLGHAGPRLLP